jgi:hypothetical protein
LALVGRQHSAHGHHIGDIGRGHPHSCCAEHAPALPSRPLPAGQAQ